MNTVQQDTDQDCDVTMNDKTNDDNTNNNNGNINDDMNNNNNNNNNNDDNSNSNDIIPTDQTNHDQQNQANNNDPNQNQNDNDNLNDDLDDNQSLAVINQILDKIPSSISECDKQRYFLLLLLIVEVINITAVNKIDFLLLFNFIYNSVHFIFIDREFAKNMLNLTKQQFLSPFKDKTDFDINHITKIYDILAASNDSTTSIVNNFQNNIKNINIKQTWQKILKCAQELNSFNTDIDNDNDNDNNNDNADNDNDEGKIDKIDKIDIDDSWKEFAVDGNVDCRDRWGKWYSSTILKYKQINQLLDDKNGALLLNKTQKKNIDNIQKLEGIYVHYDDWIDKYNEWIFIESSQSNICNCDYNDYCVNQTHRIAKVNTQSTNKPKKKKKKIEIIYKIRNFDKLIEYLNKEYCAPSGKNKTGLGAKRYYAATLNGPGGNLSKFIAWDKQKCYDRFHHSHYDWWMFPNDRDSWGQGKKYALFSQDLQDLKQVDGYLKAYKLGTRLVLKSWGWDMDKEEFITNGTSDQRWTGYNVRLLKMLYSTIILKQWGVYRSVYKFCIGVLKKGDAFRSEPMMYEYLGLEKPKFVSRWRW